MSTTIEDSPHYCMFIDGRSVDSSDRYRLINPATNAPFATCAKGSEVDADSAVAAAKRSFQRGDWKNLSGGARADVLERVADALEANGDDIARTASIENGAPIRVSRGFAVDTPVAHIRHFARLARDADQETPVPEFGTSAQTAFIRKEPIGVCVGIVPWNAPLTIAVWKAVPALAAGNSVVLKPDEKTPIGALALAELFHAAGLPSGCLNVVTGDGESVGAHLVSHPDVRMVSFTGSTAVGKQIMRRAADDITRVALELGGKSANIVLDDAALDDAVDGAVWAFMLHAGQTCESGTRLLLPDSLHDRFVERLIERLRTIKIGNPLDPATDMGPVISESQRSQIRGHIESGVAEGVTLAYGGTIPEVSDFGDGFWLSPTVLTDVEPHMSVANHEIFGPVLVVMRYSTDQEAIDLANASMYGLAAGVWSTDSERALGVARQLEAGSVWINDWHNMTYHLPYGGYKQSGLGRELGETALDEFMEVKAITMDSSGGAEPRSFAGVLSTPRTIQQTG
ncbi:aldehyde dehydrogenase family protein [Rhodococcus sp. LB1]|uniref:aldehyde dehydrogenase family protein n=1 Tax=Rhodococcus sp. LB1 TaxID=1807499 RepID=UPI00077AA123|nr:aldehyde dehydrogenase family protein [Rhodococcus sp. LB1]KXX55402.1 aldehyde dehydrogenase [Rhodococcus sp. LB1]